MNEHELTTLMERAGDGLAPDVDSLIAGGAARGRRSLRRRRAAVSFGAVAAVSVIALAATVLPGGGGTSGTGPDVVDSPSTTDERRELASRAVIEERLLDALPAGKVTDLTITTEKDDDGTPAHATVRLLLDGAEVTASIDDTSLDPAEFPDPGPRPAGCEGLEASAGDGALTLEQLQSLLESLSRAGNDVGVGTCVRWLQDKSGFECTRDAACWAQKQAPPPCDMAGCTELPDGSWLRSATLATYEDDTDRPAEWPIVLAQRATADRWYLDLEAGGPRKWAAPVLSEDQVAALAESDLWFE